MPTDMTHDRDRLEQGRRGRVDRGLQHAARRRSAPGRTSSCATRKGDRIELARNDAYWGGKPPWDKVTLRLLTNDPSRVAALLAGDVQAIENVPTADVAQAQAGQASSRSTARSPTA